MADPLYLNLWFPSFGEEEMMPRLLSVLRQFPFSAQRPGISYVAVHPISWEEPTILERRFDPGVAPEEAIVVTADLLHDDYAYVFEAFWDLWTYVQEDAQPGSLLEPWQSLPCKVGFAALGPLFEEGAHEQEGDIQVELGLDATFLYEEIRLSEEGEARVKANVQKLVNFTLALEKHSGLKARLLWSESEENLAQRLLARLQKVQ